MRAKLASLLAIAALLLPLSAAAPAHAVTLHRLTVRVIDRNGHASSALVQVINVNTDTSVMMGTGTHRYLRAGTYNLAVWITTGTQPSQTFTLADQVISLTRDRTVVLDARQGHKVRLSLNNPSAQAETLEVAPIVNGQWAFNPTTVAPPVGLTYLVPMRSNLMRLYVYSVWEKKGNTLANPSPFRYDIVKVYRGSIPTSPVISTRTSQLAQVHVTVRATDASQQAVLMLSPMSDQVVPLNDTTTLGPTPARIISYRSPGYQWQPMVTWQSPAGALQDLGLNMNPYRLGQHFETWGSAVWAPAPDALFAEVDRRQLAAGLVQEEAPVADPLHQTDEAALASKVLKLFVGSHLLAQTHGYQFKVRIPEVWRQYRLTMSVTRPAGALLSTAISGTWKFMAKGSSNDFSVPAKVYGLQLLPSGLDLRNRAAGGSLTQVALRINGPGTPVSILLPAVQAWASNNDGKTWHKVTVRRSGNHYVISVRNAAAAGFTSLRVFVGDGKGNSENLTVIHAYGVR